MPIQRITSGILANGAIVAADIADGSVTTSKLADANVTSSKLASTLSISGNFLANNVTANTNLIVPAGSNTAPSIFPSGDTNTGIFFPAADTIAFAEGGVESMRIDSSGNVGIGTTSSASKLQVGAKTSSTTSDVSTIFSAGGASASGGQIYAATFCNTVTPTNNNEVLISFTPGTNYSATSAIGCMIENTVNAYSCLKFYSYNGNLTERARITSGGEFLVGATAVGGTGWSIYPTGYAITNGSTSTFTHISFQTSSSQKGFIQTVGSTTNYNGSSDYRLKENIEPLPNALQTVSQLKPVKFNWKEDNSVAFSFIAHELQEVIPQAVGGIKDEVDENGNPIYQGIDPSKLVCFLTAAIQELKAINDAQASRIETLEAKVSALESQ